MRLGACEKAVDQGVDHSCVDPRHVAEHDNGSGDVRRQRGKAHAERRRDPGGEVRIEGDGHGKAGKRGFDGASRVPHDCNDRARLRGERGLRDHPHDRLPFELGDELGLIEAARGAKARCAAGGENDGGDLIQRPRRGCGREAISIRRPPTPIARMSASVIGTPASTRCKHPIEAVLLRRARAARRADDRRRPSAAEQQQVAGIDRHAEPFDAPADRLDRGRNDVAPVGDRRRAEHDQRVAPIGEPSRASPPAVDFVRDALVRDDPRARGRQARLEQTQGLGDDARLQARQQRRDDADPHRAKRRDSHGRRRPSAPSAASSARPGVANGMILTVATMSPPATARCGDKRRDGDRLVDAFTPSIAADVDDHEPGDLARTC